MCLRDNGIRVLYVEKRAVWWSNWLQVGEGCLKKAEQWREPSYLGSLNVYGLSTCLEKAEVTKYRLGSA